MKAFQITNYKTHILCFKGREYLGNRAHLWAGGEDDAQRAGVFLLFEERWICQVGVCSCTLCTYTVQAVPASWRPSWKPKGPLNSESESGSQMPAAGSASVGAEGLLVLKRK